MLMNVGQADTTVAKPASTHLALLSAAVQLAIPCKEMVQHVQVCMHSCLDYCVYCKLE